MVGPIARGGPGPAADHQVSSTPDVRSYDRARGLVESGFDPLAELAGVRGRLGLAESVSRRPTFRGADEVALDGADRPCMPNPTPVFDLPGRLGGHRAAGIDLS
jgi:hypothetical protein